MSERAAFIIIESGTLELFDHRWGAGILLETLLGGPAATLEAARQGEASDQVDDIVAGVVIDLEQRMLIVAGPTGAIGSGGFAGRTLPTQPHEVLGELATAWPSWALAYEPEHVIEALVLPVRNRGLALASLNEPFAVSEALGQPRWQSFAFTLTAPPLSPHPAASPAVGREVLVRPIDLDALSVRAANELHDADLELIGDIVGLDAAGLARVGITEKTRRELEDLLAEQGLAIGMTLPPEWPAARAAARPAARAG
jgi:hypothetical protein